MVVMNVVMLDKTLIAIRYSSHNIQVSHTVLHRICSSQGIQYQALRIIFKAPPKASSIELHQRAKVNSIKTRLSNLSLKYLIRAINTNNELIRILLEKHKRLNYPTNNVPTLLDLMGVASQKPN